MDNEILIGKEEQFSEQAMLNTWFAFWDNAAPVDRWIVKEIIEKYVGADRFAKSLLKRKTVY